MTTFVLLGAVHSPDLEHRIDAGLHPRLEYLELVRRHGAEIIDFDRMRRWRPSAWMSRLRALGPYWALAGYSARHHGRGDVVIATGEDVGLRLMILLTVLRRRRNRPRLAILIHGSYLDSWKFSVVAHVMRRLPNLRLLCLSEAIADELERRGVASIGLSVVGYGVDTQFFRPDDVDNLVESDLIVAAGTANRDYATLTRAVSNITAPVRIAADSAWFCEPLNVDGLSTPDNVDIRSAGDYTALRQLYARSAVVVVPLRQSRRASGYAVILEAMAMGRPVISTATLGKSDLIRDGETGVLVEPGNAAELERALADLLVDRHKAHHLASNALEFVVKRHTVECYTDRIACAAGIA